MLIIFPLGMIAGLIFQILLFLHGVLRAIVWLWLCLWVFYGGLVAVILYKKMDASTINNANNITVQRSSP